MFPIHILISFVECLFPNPSPQPLMSLWAPPGCWGAELKTSFLITRSFSNLRPCKATSGLTENNQTHLKQ